MPRLSLLRLLVLLALHSSLLLTATSTTDNFVFNGFLEANLTLDGVAEITPNGLLRLTNTSSQKIGHAFFPTPPNLKSTEGNVVSFSTTFVFAILSGHPGVSDHGMAFALVPSKNLPGVLPSQHLGLFNSTTNGSSTANHIVAVELDTVMTLDFDDINDNHVGIDVDSLQSINSTPAAYYSSKDGAFKNLSLISGEPIQVWVDFDGQSLDMKVTLSPLGVPKPEVPLLSSKVDLGTVLLDTVYVGFSASTGAATGSHYVLGWSFGLDQVEAPALDLLLLPSLPSTRTKRPKIIVVVLVPLFLLVVVVSVAGGVHVIWKKHRKKMAEIKEDKELGFGPNRISYSDLRRATGGFKEENLLGVGGFGRVYRGELPQSKTVVAVKRISHDSRQGMREFAAEITSMARLRHRNLVQLLGYCRRQDELLLVYDYMPNGNLEKDIHGRSNSTGKRLNWRQRLEVIKGVAAGLLYLHEGWEQVVIHRDIKASNVLLDADMNGKLSDFGLAKLYDHGSNPQTTRVVGTLGYLAPGLTKTGRATTMTDIYAFGIFLLEVACGRRPIAADPNHPSPTLADWVRQRWKRGVIMEAMDKNIRDGQYVSVEVEVVLKVGVLCSSDVPAARPSMRRVVQYLNGEVGVPERLQEGNILGQMMDAAMAEDDCGNYDCYGSMSLENSPFEVSESQSSSLTVEPPSSTVRFSH